MTTTDRGEFTEVERQLLRERQAACADLCMRCAALAEAAVDADDEADQRDELGGDFAQLAQPALLCALLPHPTTLSADDEIVLALLALRDDQPTELPVLAGLYRRLARIWTALAGGPDASLAG